MCSVMEEIEWKGGGEGEMEQTHAAKKSGNYDTNDGFAMRPARVCFYSDTVALLFCSGYLIA